MLCKSGAKSDVFNVLRAEQYTHHNQIGNSKSIGKLSLLSSSIIITLSPMRLDFVSRGNEMISPIIAGKKHIRPIMQTYFENSTFFATTS